MNNILLTGGSGFIGKNIINRMKENRIYDDAQWFFPKSSELDLKNADDLYQYVKQNQITKIVHTAVSTKFSGNPQMELFENCKMMQAIQKVAPYVERILVMGSGAEFGKQRPICEVKETEFGEVLPESAYGLSKYLQNELCRNADNIFNLRLFGVYGPYEDWSSCFISNICCKTIFDLPLSMRQNCLFSYIFVEDLVDIVLLFLKAPRISFKDYNIVSKEKIELREIVSIIQKFELKHLPLTTLKDGWNNEYTGCGERFLNEFNYSFKSYQDGIYQCYQWYQKHQHEIDIDFLSETR